MTTTDTKVCTSAERRAHGAPQPINQFRVSIRRTHLRESWCRTGIVDRGEPDHRASAGANDSPNCPWGRRCKGCGIAARLRPSESMISLQRSHSEIAKLTFRSCRTARAHQLIQER